MSKKINIEIENKTLIYEQESDKTLLDFLLENNISINHQCKDGFCGTCRCKLAQGQIKESSKAIGYRGSNEFLPCVSKPITNIKISKII